MGGIYHVSTYNILIQWENLSATYSVSQSSDAISFEQNKRFGSKSFGNYVELFFHGITYNK